MENLKLQPEVFTSFNFGPIQVSHPVLTDCGIGDDGRQCNDAVWAGCQLDRGVVRGSLKCGIPGTRGHQNQWRSEIDIEQTRCGGRRKVSDSLRKVGPTSPISHVLRYMNEQLFDINTSTSHCHP